MDNYIHALIKFGKEKHIRSLRITCYIANLSEITR